MGIKVMTRRLMLGAVAALALGACGPKAGEGGSSGGGLGIGGATFPTSAPDYMATYDVVRSTPSSDASPALTMTVYSTGGKTRSETVLPMKADVKMVSLMDRDAKQFVSYAEGPGMPKRANKLSADDVKRMEENFPRPDATWKPTKIGADTVAGLSCNIWQIPPRAPAADSAVTPPADSAATPPKPLEMCITDDGIMLRVGSAAEPRVLAKTVTRGPQDPALFTLPAGYEVVDMGDCLAIMRQWGEAMRNGGAKPDAAKLKDCQSKMMSGMGAP